jgi:hypothetical protein
MFSPNNLLNMSAVKIECEPAMKNFDNPPIIVGVGQKTWREPDTNRTPVDALTEASALALAVSWPVANITSS